jgi:hypothetical protein
MKNLFYFIIASLLISCSGESKFEPKPESDGEIISLREEINAQKIKIAQLHGKIKKLHSFHVQQSDKLHYYRFKIMPETEINVPQSMPKGRVEIIDSKAVSDTLALSDGSEVSMRKLEISYNESQRIPFLENLLDYKFTHAEDFYVKVVTLLNATSLPNENILILVGATRPGYRNKIFTVSDFQGIQLISLIEYGDFVELAFQHGKNPRKTESIIIKPELVRFKSTILLTDNVTPQTPN